MTKLSYRPTLVTVIEVTNWRIKVPCRRCIEKKPLVLDSVVSRQKPIVLDSVVSRQKPIVLDSVVSRQKPSY